jgi:polyisoprenoid-binding protein YceI
MHIGYAQTLGMFLDAEGEFIYDPDAADLRSGTVRIEADSVFTNHDRRDRHLRDDDFLDVGQYPLIEFEVEGYEAGADGQGRLRGQLTLLGQTHRVELDTRINRRAAYPFGHRRETLGISAHTTLQRSRWGMTYGLDGDLVGDDVKLRFEFEAIRQ